MFLHEIFYACYSFSFQASKPAALPNNQQEIQLLYRETVFDEGIQSFRNTLHCVFLKEQFHCKSFMNKQLSGASLIQPPLSVSSLFFWLPPFASWELVLRVSKALLSTRQNSLRLCCFCFHRNVISSRSARSICVFSYGRLGNTSAHFLPSTVHAVNWNLRGIKTFGNFGLLLTS